MDAEDRRHAAFSALSDAVDMCLDAINLHRQMNEQFLEAAKHFSIDSEVKAKQLEFANEKVRELSQRVQYLEARLEQR